MAYEAKTKPRAVSVEDFIAAVEPARRQADARVLWNLMAEVSGQPAVMWGPTIVGFGKHRYAYESGHSGEMLTIGFSPRKPSLVLYVPGAVDGEARRARLGKHKTGKGCLYINKLDDVNLSVLREIVEAGWAEKAGSQA